MDQEFNSFVDALLRDGAAAIHLELLAKNHHINSNLLLFLIFYAKQQRGRLSQIQVKALLKAIGLWHMQIVNPLKYLHQRLLLLQNSEKISAHLDQDIFFAETIERSLLVDVMVSPPKYRRNAMQQFNDTCFNITLYFKYLQIQLNKEAMSHIMSVLKNIFPFLLEENEHLFTNKLSVSEKGFFQISIHDF